MVLCVTLGMLVHGARRGAHPTVSPWSHAHALHLGVARIIRHSLIMHGFHGLQERYTIIRHETNSEIRLESIFQVIQELIFYKSYFVIYIVQNVQTPEVIFRLRLSIPYIPINRQLQNNYQTGEKLRVCCIISNRFTYNVMV